MFERASSSKKMASFINKLTNRKNIGGGTASILDSASSANNLVKRYIIVNSNSMRKEAPNIFMLTWDVLVIIQYKIVLRLA